MKGEVVFIKHFPSNWNGHGGEKRNAQIEDFVLKYFKINDFIYSYGHTNLVKKYFLSIYYFFQYRKLLKAWFPKKSTLELLKEGTKIINVKHLLKSNDQVLKDSQLILSENTMPNFYLITYFIKKVYGKKLIILPHNLESLVPEDKDDINDIIRKVKEETFLLSWADEVYTISQEELWLLNLLKIKSSYLPYYPEGELYSTLEQVREKRKTTGSNHAFYLILGTALNPPTRKGMLEILTHFKNRETDVQLKVAGFGTDTFKPDFSTDTIEILGKVSKSELDQLMYSCKAIIVNQGYSSGSLTKIIEFLIAGVPVICDEGSSRSFDRADGVYVYNTVDQLHEILNSDLPEPALPKRPASYFDSFIKSLKQ